MRYTRAQIGLRPRNGGPGPLDPDDVVGLVFHWPAMGGNRITTVAEAMAALRGWQDYHMDDKGWSDIAYQEAIDQAGNVYVLRGFGTQSGANGNEFLNETRGAILLLLGEGETPSKAMVATVRRRVKAHRKRFPLSRTLQGHGEARRAAGLAWTECPGPRAQGYLDAGKFNPRPLFPLPGVRGRVRGLKKLAVDRGQERRADWLGRILRVVRRGPDGA